MNQSTSQTDRSAARVRVKRPQRNQMQWRDASLEQLIPKDHRVRAVWAYVDSLDLRPLYRNIQAVEGGAGRDAVDPKLLMALWMTAVFARPTRPTTCSSRPMARPAGDTDEMFAFRFARAWGETTWA